MQCGKLNLLFVGPQMSQPITCMAAHGDMVFTANGNDIYAWTRGKQVHAYIGHTAPVHTMLCFGGHLLAVDDANVLRIWGIEDQGARIRIRIRIAAPAP
jgi:U3 small nucleolar RNA-associated protein 21